MRHQFLIALLFLASCASQESMPAIVAQSVDTGGSYHADLMSCQKWATPTRHEWAARCAANGELVMMSQIIASLSTDDARDHDAKRQSLPNTTEARLTTCLKEKGYAIADPEAGEKLASR